VGQFRSLGHFRCMGNVGRVGHFRRVGNVGCMGYFGRVGYYERYRREVIKSGHLAGNLV
jgi:hypothetical protein